MASKVLKSFLIGIGYDTKGLEAGDKKIQSSLQGIRSGALGISAALIGAFGTAAGSIVGVASRVDNLAMSTQNLRTSMNTVYGFGNAVKLMGGEASDALEALKGFEEIQNNYRLKGEGGPLNDLATAGIDTKTLFSTQTGEEFMREISRQLPGLDEGQRSQVQGALGLSDGVFRSLAGGVEKLDDTMKRASGLTGSVDQLTADARKLAENSSEFGLIIEGIKNELADGFLPSLVGAGSALNNFLKDHRGQISGAVDYAADNPAATAALGASSIAAVTGAALAKIGLSTVGGAISKTGTAGVAITGAAIGSNLLNRSLNEYVPGYGDASRGFDEALKGVTGLDRIKGPMEFMFGGDGNATQSPSSIRYEKPHEYTGKIIRSQEDVDYLDHRDVAAPKATREPEHSVFGQRSAADSMPPSSGSTPDEDRQASADALAGALSRAPIKVQNQLGVTLQIDGQALDSRITNVTERQNYEALGDLRTTTER